MNLNLPLITIICHKTKAIFFGLKLRQTKKKIPIPSNLNDYSMKNVISNYLHEKQFY